MISDAWMVLELLESRESVVHLLADGELELEWTLPAECMTNEVSLVHEHRQDVISILEDWGCPAGYVNGSAGEWHALVHRDGGFRTGCGRAVRQPSSSQYEPPQDQQLCAHCQQWLAGRDQAREAAYAADGVTSEARERYRAQHKLTLLDLQPPPETVRA